MSLVEVSPSTVMQLNVRADDVAQRAIEHAGRDRGVGDDERKHRGHVGMNHSRRPWRSRRRARSFPPMRQVAAALFRARVRGHDRARQAVEGASAKIRAYSASSGAAFRMRSTGSGTPITPVEQTTTCCARQPSSSATRSAVAREATMPPGPDRAIGVAGIDDDGAHRVRRRAHVLARKNDRRRLHEILREHGGGRRRRDRKRSARRRASPCGRAS